MELIEVEVVYALPQEQMQLKVKLAAGSTVQQAIEASGVLQRYPQIELESAKVGIFGRTCKLDDPVRAGDRVEIYRPLSVDPKEARRKRAHDQR